MRARRSDTPTACYLSRTRELTYPQDQQLIFAPPAAPTSAKTKGRPSASLGVETRDVERSAGA